MSGTSDSSKGCRPTAFEDALARLEAEVHRREPRRLSLDEIVAAIREHRGACDV